MNISILNADHLLGPESLPPSFDSLAIAEGRIRASGPLAELRARFPSAPVERYPGCTLLPAFADHHLHLGEMLRRAAALDLSACLTMADVEAALRSEAKGEGWLTAFGLNLNRFEGWTEAPREFLSRLVQNRPLAVFSQDLHSIFVNQAALMAAGIQQSADGVLKEDQGKPIRQALPLPEGRELRQALERVARDLHKLGIAAADDMGGSEVHFRLHGLSAPEALPLKIRTSIYEEDLDNPRLGGFVTGKRRGRLADGPLKLFADGSLGSRNAWMHQAYVGGRDHGQPNYSEERLAFLIRRARARGLSLAVHAIGDRTVGWVAKALGSRDRMEHVQHVRREDVALLAASGAAACVNPEHIPLDLEVCGKLLPGEGRGAYAFAWMAEAGVPLLFASDATVAEPGPLRQLRWAEARQDATGNPAGGWFPEQRIPRALGLSALWQRGAGLSVGMPADLLAIDGDLMEVHALALDGLAPRQVWLEGESLFD